MKHVIIFLNYNDSRLENPVYRYFATESLTNRRAALMFENHTIDERKFLHEVKELLGKHRDEDLTFHITKPLIEEDDANEIVLIARKIRQLFAIDAGHTYPIYGYALTKPLSDCTSLESRKLLRNLGKLNNAIADFPNGNFIRTVFLFHDDTYAQLARYLYAFTRIDDKVELKPKNTPEPAVADNDSPFLPVFGSFNAIGETYPEAEIRAYLHQSYLSAVLRRHLPEVNPTPMEKVNAEAQRILSLIPLAPSRICLQEDSFLVLGDDGNYHWTPADQYWEQELRISAAELNEIPRDDWFSKIQKRAELLYQGKFRGLGTDFFFSLQMKKTEAYTMALLEIIRSELLRTVSSYSFTPYTLKNIVRAITNVLQQRVLTLQTERDRTAAKIPVIKRHIHELENRWSERGFFSRFGGKDMRTLNIFYDTLRDYEIQRTWIPGYDFAIKLLNELIPQVSSLVDPFEALRLRFADALSGIQQTLNNTRPSSDSGVFSIEETEKAARAIDDDAEHMLRTYQEILLPAYKHIAQGNDDDTLMTMVRNLLTTRVDNYLEQRMSDGYLPQVLQKSIVERIDQKYRFKGGFMTWMDESRKKAPVSLAIKPQTRLRDYWLLVSPHIGEYLPVPIHETHDTSQIQLLHIIDGIRLSDFDGFAGHSLFVEPNIF